jgi:hypothetical protein
MYANTGIATDSVAFHDPQWHAGWPAHAVAFRRPPYAGIGYAKRVRKIADREIHRSASCLPEHH